MAAPSSDGHYWINILLITGGWAVVHLLSSRRDQLNSRRKVVAETVDKLIDDANELLTQSSSYHLGQRSNEIEAKIKITLSDMGMSLSGLKDIAVNSSSLPECQSGIKSLRRSITGSHFEDEHTGPIAANDQILQSIASTVTNLKGSLARLKHSQYISL